jgi:5-methylcytosine-specific restriction endonuclease McrA
MSRRKQRDPALLEQRHREQDGRCLYCKQLTPRADGVLDHWFPLSKGGTNRRGNMVFACARCDRLKGSHVFARVPSLEELERRIGSERVLREARRRVIVRARARMRVHGRDPHP